MTFYVKDPATDKAVRKLAKLQGKTLTETIREAVEIGAGRPEKREKSATFLERSSPYRTACRVSSHGAEGRQGIF